jgi:hypothetical protein
MPDEGEAILVEVVGGDQHWTVTGLGKCRDYWSGTVKRLGCGEDIFWCRTPNDKAAPVDTIPNNEGVYTAHHITCKERIKEQEERKRGTAQARLNMEAERRASGRDRAAGRD